LENLNYYNLTIGVLLGILSSFLTWWLLSHLLVPKIRFAPFLSKIKVRNQNKFRYRIGFINTGRRSIIDLEIYFKLVIKGYDVQLPRNTHYIEIPLREPKINRVKCGTRWTIDLILSDLPDKLRAITIDQNPSLEDLLKYNRSTYAKIFIFGFDQYSGTRKFFESQAYRSENIKGKLFKHILESTKASRNFRIYMSYT